MHKSFREGSKKALRVLVLLPFFAQTFISPILALDEILPDLEVDIPIDTSEDILEEGISTGPEDEVWVVEGDTATTNDVVVLDEVYTAPQNGAVSLTFTRLPEESGFLTIKEITLTDEEVEATNAVSSVAYDISTDMKDGTYEYDLTLPTTEDDINVVYAEERSDIVNGTTEVNEEFSVEDGVVTVEGLDHFTIFVVAAGVTDGSTCTVSSITGTCYDTIQEAINNADPGDQIFVDSSYDSSDTFPILVNEEVELYGVQADTDPRPSEGGRSGDETVVDANESSSSVFRISASNVEINGFTITGGTADMVEEDGSADNLRLAYNTLFDDLGSAGDEAVQIKYSDGVVIEYNYAYNIVQDAFNLSSSTNGYVQYNEAHDIYSENAVIYCYDDIDVSIIGNIVYNSYNNDGIKLGDSGDGTTGGSVSDNTVYNSSEDGMTIYASGVTVDSNVLYNNSSENGALYLYQADNSTVTNNQIYDNSAIGILLKDLSNVIVSGNEVYNNNDSDDTKYAGSAGVWVTNDSDAATITINNNEIYDNADYGLLNEDSSLLDAKYNWWGDNSGPYDGVDTDSSIPLTNMSGTGNTVGGTVDYSLWTEKDTTPPSVPVLESPIGGIYTNDNTPLMQWGDSSDDDSGVAGYYYQIYYNCSDESNIPGSCSSFYAYPSLIVNSELQAGTTPDNTFYWQVKAVDNAGNESDWSDFGIFTIDTQGPEAPDIVFPDAETYFNSSPILNDWTEVDDPSGILHYRVEYEYDDGHSFSNMPYRTTTSTQRNHTPVEWEQGGVSFRVQAIDNAGNQGEWSEWRHYTYDSVEPTVPTNLSFETTEGEVLGCGSSTNEYTIVATWDASTDETTDIAHYGYRSYNPTTGWVWGPVDVGNVTERQGSFTVGEGTYGFAVRAVDLAGNLSDWTSIDLASSCQITYDVTAPDAPTGLHILDNEGNDLGCGGYTNNRNITIDWEDNTESDFAYYLLDLKDKDGHKELTVSEYDGTIRDIDDLYKYKIRAVDEAGNISDASSWCEVTLDRVSPEVEVTSHNDGDLVNGLISISGDIYDLNLSHYWFVVTNSSGSKVAGPGTVTNPGPSVTRTFDWNTNGIDDGIYTIKLEARDLAGNKDPDEAPVTSDPEIMGDSVDWVTVVVDNSAPVTTFTPDFSEEIFNSPILISGESVDENNVQGVNLYYRPTGTSTWLALTTLTNPNPLSNTFNWSYTWTPGDDGTYDIKASAYDSLGNTENSPVMRGIVFDTTQPDIGNISIFMDYVSQYVNGFTGFSGKAKVTDSLSGVDTSTCEYTLNGTDWNTGFYNVFTNNCTFYVGSLPDTEELYINIRMQDRAGNSNQGIDIKRIADSQLPFVDVSIDDNFYGPNTFSASTIKGTATDTVSDITSVKISLQRSSDSKYWRKGIFSSSYAWRTGSLPLNDASGTDTWTYNSMISAFDNGVEYTVIPHAWDEVHLVPGTGSSDSFTWDSEAPDVINFQILVNGSSTATWAKAGDTITVIALVVDPLSGTKAVSADFSYNSTYTSRPTPQSISMHNIGGNMYRATYTIPSAWNEGPLYITVATRDNVENYSPNRGIAEMINIDNTKPSLTIDSPSTDDILGEQFTVEGTAEDTGSGLNQIRIRFRDSDTNALVKTCYATVENNWSININDGTCNVPDGTYTIVVRAKDNVGHVRFVSVSNITIDSIAPTTPELLGFLNPDLVCGAITNSKTVTVDWTDSDGTGSDIKGYQYQISYPTTSGGRAVWMTYFNGTTSQYTGSLNEGSHYIRVRAQDMAGNWSDWSDIWVNPSDLTEDEMENTCSITYDSISPDITLESPINGSYIAGDIFLQATCNEDCDYINFWWKAEGEDYSNTSPERNYHYIHDNGTIFEWTLDSLNAERWGGDPSYVMTDGIYYFYAAGKDLADNWARSNEIMITVDNTDPIISNIGDMKLLEGEAFPTDTVTLTENNPNQVCATATDLTGTLGTSGEICIDVDTSNFDGTLFSLADEIRTAIEDWQGNPFTNIDLNVLPDGEYEISYYATDMAGNQSTEQTFTVTILDNVPTVEITPNDPEVTVGDTLTLNTTVTNGNFPFTYEWTGDCTGTGDTTSVNTDTAGTYTCTVTITDADGDTGTDTVDITVVEQAVLGTSTTSTTGSPTTFVYGTGIGAGGGEENGDEDGEDKEEEEETNDEEEVLGESTCDTKYKISGTVFYDKDDNGELDENEKGVEGIEVNIYDNDGGLIKTVTTDEDGYWETYLCPGDYTTQVEGAEDQSFTLEDSNMTLNIAVEKKFPWWWLVIIGSVLILLIGVLIDRRKKKQESQF